jgi:hypothetical protein
MGRWWRKAQLAILGRGQWQGLPNLAKKNTDWPVEFGFHLNNKYHLVQVHPRMILILTVKLNCTLISCAAESQDHCGCSGWHPSVWQEKNEPTRERITQYILVKWLPWKPGELMQGGIWGYPERDAPGAQAKMQEDRHALLDPSQKAEWFQQPSCLVVTSLEHYFQAQGSSIEV